LGCCGAEEALPAIDRLLTTIVGSPTDLGASRKSETALDTGQTDGIERNNYRMNCF